MTTKSELTRVFFLSELAEKLCQSAFAEVHAEKELGSAENLFTAPDEFIKMLQHHVAIDFERIYNYVVELYAEHITQWEKK